MSGFTNKFSADLYPRVVSCCNGVCWAGQVEGLDIGIFFLPNEVSGREAERVASKPPILFSYLWDMARTGEVFSNARTLSFRFTRTDEGGPRPCKLICNSSQISIEYEDNSVETINFSSVTTTALSGDRSQVLQVVYRLLSL
jgi:hypothetical protein